MNSEHLIIWAILIITSAVLVGSITGEEPQDVAYSIATSVIISPTQLETVATVSAYNYGFSCHYITTSEALKALRNNDFNGALRAEEKRRDCFSDAVKIINLGK